MEAFLVSVSSVALAEMGDRTQLLTLLLAARYRRPWAILAGVLIATLANHLIAAALGVRLGAFLTASRVDLLVGLSMIVMGLWALRPEPLAPVTPREKTAGPFVATLIAFFIAEMGDRTQLATMALAAAYSSVAAVVAGTTTGMLLANAPAVFLGQAFAGRLPLRTLHLVAAAAFVLIGALFLWRSLQLG